jgi:hypothetical protein
MTTGDSVSSFAAGHADRRLRVGCRWLTRVVNSAPNIPFGAAPAVLLAIAPIAQMGQSWTADAVEASVSCEMVAAAGDRGRAPPRPCRKESSLASTLQYLVRHGEQARSGW